ncbi:hypothetical protein Pmani_012055 [Petrolisthes manimaculis]|uniref:Uncharacterized protein n=1 Tax=Petrolisthes manimaculis TaxID=1843537 RepID=A0AAE1Q1K6_9EUCA|nr:hypothetical protein Pmani_012055 [Petrolisthes manimaculis]
MSIVFISLLLRFLCCNVVESSDPTRVTGATNGDQNETLHQPNIDDGLLTENIKWKMTLRRSQKNDNTTTSVQCCDQQNSCLHFSDEGTAAYENVAYTPDNNTYDVPSNSSQPVKPIEKQEPIYDRPRNLPMTVLPSILNSPGPIYDNPPLPTLCSVPVHHQIGDQPVYDQSPKPIQHEGINQVLYDQLPPKPRPVQSEEVNYSTYDHLPSTSKPVVHSEEGNDRIYDNVSPKSRPI